MFIIGCRSSRHRRRDPSEGSESFARLEAHIVGKRELHGPEGALMMHHDAGAIVARSVNSGLRENIARFRGLCQRFEGAIQKHEDAALVILLNARADSVSRLAWTMSKGIFVRSSGLGFGMLSRTLSEFRDTVAGCE